MILSTRRPLVLVAKIKGKENGSFSRVPSAVSGFLLICGLERREMVDVFCCTIVVTHVRKYMLALHVQESVARMQ